MMMTKVCNTQYEILWIKISKAVEIDTDGLPGVFQRVDAEGQVVTIGAWVVTAANDPVPNNGGWMLMSVGFNGLMWVRRNTNCKLEYKRYF